jgi:hypothetical protein
MDPTSVSVAFISLAASLSTLTALVVDSSKTLANIRREWRSAPEDIKRLYRQLRDFECLLCQVQEQIRDNRVQFAASGMEVLFLAIMKYMPQDLDGLERAVQKLKSLICAPTSSGKRLEGRIRHILQEDRVKEYQALISSHVGTLTLLMEIMTR